MHTFADKDRDVDPHFWFLHTCISCSYKTLLRFSCCFLNLFPLPLTLWTLSHLIDSRVCSLFVFPALVDCIFIFQSFCKDGWRELSGKHHQLWSQLAKQLPMGSCDLILIRAGSAGKHWPEVRRMILAYWLVSGLDPFGQNLAQSATMRLDLGWFCMLLSGTSVEECNRVWKWETGSRSVVPCREPGSMISANQLASD